MGRAAPSLVCISPDQRTTTHTSLSRLRKLSLGLSALLPLSSVWTEQGQYLFLDSDFHLSFVCLFSNLTASDCQACEEADTYENIMDNYCRADFGKSTLLLP